MMVWGLLFQSEINERRRQFVVRLPKQRGQEEDSWLHCWSDQLPPDSHFTLNFNQEKRKITSNFPGNLSFTSSLTGVTFIPWIEDYTLVV